MTSVIWLLWTHLIIEPAREQPADAEHVHGRAHGAIAEAVFALPKFPRPMIDRDFHETVTGAFHEGRNETMHAFEGDQRRDAFALHCFQRTAGIAHAVLREAASNEIRDAARDALNDRVFALGAITADQIGSGLALSEQL